MRVLYFLLSWIFFIDFAFSASDDSFQPFGRYEFYLGKKVANYAAAEKQCRKRNASLAILNSKAINNFLVYEMGKISDSYPYSFYIGLKRILPNQYDWISSVFQWIDGSPLIYSNWNYFEPNGMHGTEYCVTVGWSNRLEVDSKWRDTGCTTTSRYVCQRPHKGDYPENNATAIEDIRETSRKRSKTPKRLRTRNFAEKSLQGINRIRNNILSTVETFYSYPYEGGAPTEIYGGLIFDRGNEVRVFVNEARTVFAVYNRMYSSSAYEFSTRTDYPFMALLWIKNPNARMVNYTIQVSGMASRVGSHSFPEGAVANGKFKAQYKVFQTYRADWRPSICEVYFVISSSAVWQSSPHFNFSVVRFSYGLALLNSVAVVGRPHRSMMGYFLLSKSNSLAASVAEIEEALRLVLSTFLPENFAEVTLSNFNRVRGDIKASVEHWYNYQYDGVEPTEINTGGSDMYARGNRVRVYENETEIIFASYNKTYSTNMYDFSSRASLPFIALLWIKNPEESSVQYKIQVSGNVGTGNGGLYSRFNGTAQFDEFTAQYYVFQLHGSNGPSICEVYFVLSSYSVWRSSNDNILIAHIEKGTDRLSNSLSLQGKPQRTMLGYTLLSSLTGDRLLLSQIERVLQLLMYSLIPKNFAEKNLQSISPLNRNITSSIPNWYSYKYDGNDPKEIYNGGGDMYNRGNRVRTFCNGWEITDGIYNRTYSVPRYDFSTRAEYPFIALFWMKERNYEICNFTMEVSGNNILRDNRTISSLEGKINNGAFKAEYVVFQAQRTGGPSICEVYFFILSETVWQSSLNYSFSVNHFSTATDKFMSNSASVQGRPNKSMMGYTLLSRENGKPVSKSEIEYTLRVIMSRLVPDIPAPHAWKPRDVTFLPSCTIRQIITRASRCESILSIPITYEGPQTCRSNIDKVIRCVLNQLAPCKRGRLSGSIDAFGLPYFNSKAMVTYLRGLRLRKGVTVNKEINTFCFHAPLNLTYPHKVETDLHMCDGSFLDDLLAQAMMFYNSYTWARNRADICSAFHKLRQWFVESTRSRCNIGEGFRHLGKNMRFGVKYMELLVDIMLEVVEGFEASVCFSEIERTARRSR